ncbi:hypothetical protein ACFE04_015255 [Oxalis oulophora]
MWRRLCSTGLLKQTLTTATITHSPSPLPSRPLFKPAVTTTAFSSSSSSTPSPSPSASKSIFDGLKKNKKGEEEEEEEKLSDPITLGEAKKLMRLVNIESLKTKLGMEGKEVIGYAELLKACESIGVARSMDEARAFARVLDEAGVVLLFRDKVYLHPDKVVDLVRKAVPLALSPDDDPTDLKNLIEKKEEIDLLAHKQVRRILWSGLGLAVVQVGLFFRLTFWEFSWDVMEPIAFFTTTAGIVIGYAYFLFTARDPTYQDLMKRLFLSRQRKLFKKHNFDVQKFKELQCKSRTRCDAATSIRNRVGMDLELDDAVHRD